MHRLDAGSSGVVSVRPHAGRGRPLGGRARRAPEAGKEYLVLSRGITRPKGTIALPLRDDGRLREARTRYRREQIVGGHSLLRVRIEHGRTHQIRRHLAALGHPVLGDARTGHAASNRHLAERFGLDRPFLHCARITLVHPRTGAPITIPLGAARRSRDRARSPGRAPDPGPLRASQCR